MQVSFKATFLNPKFSNFQMLVSIVPLVMLMIHYTELSKLVTSVLQVHQAWTAWLPDIQPGLCFRCPSIPGYGFSEASHKQDGLFFCFKAAAVYSCSMLLWDSTALPRMYFSDNNGVFKLFVVLSAGRTMWLKHS